MQPDKGKNSKFDAVLREDIEGCVVCCTLGQPHSFGLAAEAGFEIANAPNYLRLFVTIIGQRHNHVVIRLRERGAMTRKAFPAFLSALTIAS